MSYNKHLYHHFLGAAKTHSLKVYAPNNGSCLYLRLPQHIAEEFWCMLWTPVNRFNDINISRQRRYWKRNIEEIISSGTPSFHLEFCHKNTNKGSYYWFPEINFKPSADITQSDIEACISRILDEANWDKNTTWAILNEPAEDKA